MILRDPSLLQEESGATMRRQHPQEDPSRRDFFRHAACAAVGTTALVSTVWDLRIINAAVADKIATLSAQAGDYKALVCLFLYGGEESNKKSIPHVWNQLNNLIKDPPG